MANLSELTRKEQVLQYLRSRTGLWVDGSVLATEEVGGSEGLRRLRELRDEGVWNIQERKHPDPDRDIWQYRLMPRRRSTGEPAGTPVPAADGRHPEPEPQSPQPTSPWPADSGQTRIRDAVRRREDGTFEYVPPQPALQQLKADMPDRPSRPATAFDRKPERLIYGEVAVCPRCKAKTTRGPGKSDKDPAHRRERGEDVGLPLVDDDGVLLYREPNSRKPKPCIRCNGYGVVPNIGPIQITMPNE